MNGEEFAEELYRENLYFVYEDKCNELEKEIERLNNIIKEVREYIEPIVELDNDIMLKGKMLKPVLEIIDKEVN